VSSFNENAIAVEVRNAALPKFRVIRRTYSQPRYPPCRPRVPNRPRCSALKTPERPRPASGSSPPLSSIRYYTTKSFGAVSWDTSDPGRVEEFKRVALGLSGLCLSPFRMILESRHDRPDVFITRSSWINGSTLSNGQGFDVAP
jgi:hypothetical protein